MQPEIVPPKPDIGALQVPPDFSPVVGGPLYQLYLRAGLARPPLELVKRRMLVMALICWLPLLLLAASAGHLTSGVTAPFLLDPEVHMRFLVALPLLVVSEVIMHVRIRSIVEEFLQRGIITRQDQPRYEKIIASATRLRNSAAVEIVLSILVTTLGYWLWRQRITISASSWYAVGTGTRLNLTAAGSYYALVSLSIFRFILYRWYFRIFIWYRFLWHVRGLPLRLNLYHPDRAGGLGFLSLSLPGLALVFAAHSMVLAAVIYTRILYAGQQLPAFVSDIATALVLFVIVVIFPMGFFAVQLEEAGRKARLEFGTLASRYVDDFRQKWIRSAVPAQEPLLGTSDIQSLADLANSFGVVNEIRLVPITWQNLVFLVTIVAVPFVPLVLTMLPLNEVIKRLMQLL